ncbi:MAG TPA: hypothetical protein VLD39_09590, partial [Gammaproteobacteria bacterium]|nr:hypothetical protein [Gammaproteobacteria bacterium]
GRLHGPPPAARCPFLQEADVEYCGAVPIPRYVPASDALMSHCSSGGHLYCDIYLSYADPEGERLPRESASTIEHEILAGEHTAYVDGIPIPQHLWYTPNHLWVDVNEEGRCHIGIDALLARVVGEVSAVSFPQMRSTGRPVAVLTVAGVDFPIVFPNDVREAEPNVYLRTNPERIAADPYGVGWLFAGREPSGVSGLVGDSLRHGLTPGHEAVEWFRAESDRLARYAHELIAREGPLGVAMADGGTLAPGFAKHLGRDELIELLTVFFGPTSVLRR